MSNPNLNLRFGRAREQEAAALAALRTAVAERLTTRFGRGHWSSVPSEKSVAHDIRRAHVLVAYDDPAPVATLTLTTRKPWAIDRAYFTPADRPLYLIDMAVAADRQGQGIGRLLLAEGIEVAKSWPADAIWLDAYDAAAGAGGFYVRCGFREVGRVTYRGTPLIYFELRL